MDPIITYHRDRLDRYLGVEPAAFEEDRFEPPDTFAGDVETAFEKARAQLEGMIHPGMTPREMQTAYKAFEESASRTIAQLRDDRIRLCFVIRRQASLLDGRLIDGDRPFHVVARPTLRDWIRRQLADLGAAIEAARESLRRKLAFASVLVKQAIRSLLSILAAIRDLKRSGDPEAAGEAPRRTLRDLIGELASPHVLAAGTGPGLFVPRC